MTEMRLRRHSYWIIPIVWVLLLCSGGVSGQVVGEELPSWSEGMLDIHQISTGKGNSAFCIFPDGTTLLIDAGALGRPTARHVPPRPDNSRTPGEWIVRYIRHVHPRHDNVILDYALLTHFHGDHMGSLTGDSPISASGAYRLAGITEVGDYVETHKLLDRGWPEYNYPAPLDSETMVNYRAFIKWQTANRGMQVERLQPGRNDQIVPVYAPEKYPGFEVRNITANGEVWTGVGTNTRHHFPPLDQIPAADHPSENPCSIGLRISYGKFDYFTGGDITGSPAAGGPAWHDVETPVAKVVGPVEVSVLNHHGYIDSQNEFFVETLRPRVWILSVWDSAHPTSAVFHRLFSTRLYPGKRDLFATSMHEANKIVISGLDRIASSQGHIVVRVAPGGDTYQVIIIDDSAETYRVQAVHGPWETR